MNHLKSHAVAGHIHIEELTPGYPVLVVKNRNASARIALHGAHVIDYTPTGERPVIFTSAEAIYQEGKAIRGGIPICWPWFNAHPSDPSQPSHGLARYAFWELFRSASDEEIATLIFTFSRNNLHAELTVKIGKELILDLKTTNTGDDSVAVGGALHSYFSVGDISEISISGLEETNFHNALTGSIEQDSEAIKVNEETDRIYLNTTRTVTLRDTRWQREIHIEKTGSKSTVVWNPWIKKAASMADLGNEEYQKFVCIEAANALGDDYLVAPGCTHSLSTKISVATF